MALTADQLNTIYQNVLFRPVDPAGIAAFANRSDISDAQVRQQIELSTEANTYVTPIVRLYEGALGRVPDVSGLSFFVGELRNSNFNYQAIVNQFLGTSEYQARNGTSGTVTATLVTNLYTDLLGRSPSSAEINYWVANKTAAQTLDGIANSAESINRNAAGVLTFLDSAAVGSPNTGTLNNQTGSNVGTTFTLTTGTDNFTGTAGNDIFNAATQTSALGAQQPTLTGLDNINGAGGNNTLNVADTTAAFTIPSSATIQNIQTVTISSTGTVQGDASKISGLTALNVTQTGGSGGGNLTAASTTNVALTDVAAAASNTTVLGGNNVNLTLNGVTAGGTITVGSATASQQAVGNIVVTTNELATRTANGTADAITVNGGTTVVVNANLSEAGGAGTVTGGVVTVNGGASTTAVTVNQTTAATAAAAVAASTGSLAVTAVAAAPGINAVTGSAASGNTTAKAAVAGVIDGAVTITDGNAAGANTIATVALSNYGAGSSITSNALTNLTLSGTGGTLALTRTAANSSSTLNLALNAVTTVDSAGNAANGGNSTITDTNNEITTLNVTTGTGTSTLTAFADTGLKTLNVAGAGTLVLGTVNTSLTSIAVSGAAGFTGNISANGAATTLTTTSSGTITATLDAATQTFVGSTGRDVITISADAKKAITGGSGTTDEIVLNAAAGTFNADANKYTTTNVTGFEVLGLGTAATGTYDVSTFGGSNIKALEVFGTTAGAVTFSKVTTGAFLQIDAANAQGITVATSDGGGTSDAFGVVLGAGNNKAGFTTTSLTLTDANGVGPGTLNVTSNASTFGSTHTITTLVDNGLSTLNVSGTGGLTIGALAETANQATSFTINNTSSGATGVTITALTDTTLGSLTFSGTGPSTVTTLTDSATTLTIANNGSGSATVTNIVDATLANLTLTGNVALGTNDGVAATATGATTGFTLNAGSDNAHINFTLTGAASGATDNITVGNANNLITDNSTAGTVNVTVGTGYNIVDVHTGANNSTYAANVTLGTHTSTATLFDQVNVSVTGSQAAGFSTSITGGVTNDHITFQDANPVLVTTFTAGQLNTIGGASTLQNAVTAAFAALPATAHEAAAFQYGGNTYVIENVANDQTFTAGTDSVVKVTGVHTIATSATAGHIVLAS